MIATIGAITSVPAQGQPQFLSGSVFEYVGNSTGVDPLLLYSIAITESGTGQGGGLIAPYPYVIRTADGPVFYKTAAEAISALEHAMLKSTNIDVGMMQRNLYWNPTDDFESLFDPLESVTWAANALIASMNSTPDRILGIGRYHNWSDPVRARSYGRRVMKIYKNLENM